jgi:hypothetical protein
MALSASIHWDVRTTGSDTNGGGFKNGATGTDYSQQDAAEVTYTDLVIGGTNTQLTSAAFPFTSAHVGNVINITSGTGFTTGRYEVVSVASSIATMDRAVGTASSTGGAGKLGGAFASLAPLFVSTAGNFYTSLNSIWVKTGTYTVTSTLQINSTQGFYIYGYGSTHGDNGTRPLITTATNSTALFLMSGGSTFFFWHNLNFSNTASTRADCFSRSGGGSYPFLFIESCTFDGFAVAINGHNAGGTVFSDIFTSKVEIKNCTSSAIINLFSIHLMAGTYIHNCGADAVVLEGGGQWWSFDRVIIANNTGKGLKLQGDSSNGGVNTITNCTIYGNTGDGIFWNFNFSSIGPWNFVLMNSIIYGNGGWGLNAQSNTFTQNFVNKNNALGGNTSGNRSSGIPAAWNDVTLTANPFTNPSSGDFTLNSTAGGGLACKGAGYQWGS